MINTKKFISVSSVIIITGATMISSVSADEMVSNNEDISTTSETVMPVAGAPTMDDITKMQDPLSQCLAYVKFKNLTGIDCKAKVEAMRQAYQTGRVQMNQEIKDAKAQMNQNIKDSRNEFKEEMKKQHQEFKDNAKEKRQEFKETVKAKKQALSEKNKAILTKIVNSFSLERLQVILAKVDKALAVSKKERVIAQLNEIAEIVQNKIDELTGVSSEESVIEDILGTDSTSTTSATESGASTMTQ